ncbi:MAG: MerR family DNA-binding transcriptional regulator, partial [Patescibacteria group bacterium]
MNFNPALNTTSKKSSDGTKKILSVSEACSILKISPSTLRRLEKEGKIASSRLTNNYRVFDYHEILELRDNLQNAKLKDEDLKLIEAKTKKEHLSKSLKILSNKVDNFFREHNRVPVYTGAGISVITLILTLLLIRQINPKINLEYITLNQELLKVLSSSKKAEENIIDNGQKVVLGQEVNSIGESALVTTPVGSSADDSQKLIIIDQNNASLYPLGGDNKSLGTDDNRWRSIFAKKFTLDKEGALFLDGPVDVQANVVIDDSLKVRDTFEAQDRVILGSSSSDIITINGTSTFNALATFTSNLTVGGTATLNGLTNLNGNVTIGGDLTVTQDLTIEGDLSSINGVSYSWPTTPGLSSTVLTNDGSGNLTWSPGGGGGGSTAWSSITAPTGALSLSMGSNASTFTYSAATGSTNLFNLTDTASNTGTGYLLNISTASSSALNPLRIVSAGVQALSVNSAGNVGVGTTAPGVKLDVVGTARATTLNATSTFTLASESITDITGTGLTNNGGSLEASLGTSVDLGSEVTGTLPVGNGGTGASTFASNGILFGNGSSAIGTTSASTNGQLLLGVTSGAPAFASMSSDATISSSGVLTIASDAVALTTDTTGNYVQAITNGSGIAGGNGGSEGANLTLSLGALSSNWDQTGAFDIILNNSSSEVRILESAGGVFYGTLDVDDLASDASYTFSGTSGLVLTNANYSGTLDSVYVNVAESPAAGDISGSFSAGLTVGLNTVALGSDTTGDYVASFTAGGGLTGDASGEGSAPTLAVGTGIGITVNANDVAVDVSFSPTWTGAHTFTPGSTSDITLNTDSDSTLVVTGLTSAAGTS